MRHRLRRDTNRFIAVRSTTAPATQGRLSIGGCSFPCALGRSGRRHMKREGDGATPIGDWPLREAFYRPDRMRRPLTGLPLRALHRDDGWCDATGDRNYNRNIRRPYPGSAEGMWREDHLYDIVIVAGYNDFPRVQGLGSAIFMHLARPGYTPSEGCVTLKRAHMLRLLVALRPGAVLRVL